MRGKDMHLPNWVCGFGVLMLACSIVLFVKCFSTSQFSMVQCILGGVICFGFGISAVLCWKNQWAEMLNDHEFIYSTMFGRQTKYCFSEIKEIRRNRADITLIMENGSVFIESSAIMSDRFASKIQCYLTLM